MALDPMIVLTVKRDGGTQDVRGFYPVDEIDNAMEDAATFLKASLDCARAIARIELYNPPGVTMCAGTVVRGFAEGVKHYPQNIET